MSPYKNNGTYQNRGRVSLFGSLMSARFLLTAFILILAATGLRPGMKALSQRYTKKAIAIRRPLKEFDTSLLPSFRDGWDFVREKLPASEEALGTDEHILLALNKKGQKDVSAGLFITYYSDPKDKVPHTPEMCYAQIGVVIKERSIITIETPELGREHPQTRACLLRLDMPKSNSDQVYIYCFYAEGEFRVSRNRTRLVLNKPGNRHTYFSKIEVYSLCPTDGDSTEAIEICQTLFREVLSVLLKEHFPSRDQLKGR